MSIFGMVLAFVPVFAQPLDLRKTIRFQRYSLEQGLSHHTVYDIAQDEKGFLWFGTGHGLNRYDGYHFKLYIHDPTDPTSLSANLIRSLYLDRTGLLWIGTHGGGLNRYEAAVDGFKRYRASGPSSNHITAIQEDLRGRLWVGTEKGLDWLEPGDHGRFHAYDLDPGSGFGRNHVVDIHLDQAGLLWVATLGYGLVRLNPERPGSVVRYQRIDADPGSLPTEDLLTIYEDRGGWLWLGTTDGLVRFDREAERFDLYQADPHGSLSLSHNLVQSIIEDDDGRLWIGTNGGGLNLFDRSRKRVERYQPDRTDPHSLSANEIVSLFRDRSGVIWVGTMGQGVNQFHPAGFQLGHYRFNLESEDEQPWVLSFREDRSGNLWCGTSKGIVLYNRDRQWVARFQHDPGNPHGLSENWVMAIEEDHRGDLWFGTYGGGINKLSKGRGLDKGLFTHYRTEPENPRSLSHDQILDIYEDNQGVLWVGTTVGGLNRLELEAENEGFYHYRHHDEDPHSLTDNTVTTMLQDRGGSLWVGTKNGLNRLLDDGKTGRFVRYRNRADDPRSLSGNAVICMYEDQLGTLWIGTDSGLNKLVRGNTLASFDHYGQKESLPNEVIHGILGDEEGYLWLSTNVGLARFDPETRAVRAYDVRDGLQSNVFISNARYQSPRGELFFGGTNGFNAFYPGRITANHRGPPIVITEFLLYNEPVIPRETGSPLRQPIHETSQLLLTHRDKVFTFEFSALDFAAPGKNRYAYRLEGWDEHWTMTNAKKRFATYTNLDPGSYHFRVRGSNKDGIWNDRGAAIKITILPPWWKTRWAYILYAIFLVVTVLGYLRSHRKKLAQERAINEQLDRQVAERTRDLQAKNAEILEKQALLVSQAQKLEEQASRLQKMDALKTRFFTNISHEFRTPLTLTLGPIEDLLTHCQAVEIRRKLEMAKRNGRKLKKLIDELLELSKLEAGSSHLRASATNLHGLVRRCGQAFTSLAESRQMKLTLPAKRKDLTVHVDREKMEKVLTNLIANAFNFTPDGGEVQVFVNEEEADRADIHIIDSGKGIPASEIPYIFDRFYQGRDRTGPSSGTGVGLSLAKELVKLHGGRIEVRSQPGSGSEFVVSLRKGKDHLESHQVVVPDHGFTGQASMEPVETGVGETTDPTSLDGQDPNENQPILLLIEDNADIRAYLREELSPGYRILEARDGETGLELARKKIPDLVITDVMMQGLDGFEVCRRLKTDERTSHIPVIMLTAKADQESQITGLETGADDYIIKPFGLQILSKRIANLIRTRQQLRMRFSQEMLLGPAPIALSSTDQVFLQKTQQCLEEHLSDAHFGVYELAENVGFSRRQLHRKLTALTGLTPAQFIRKFRLERAAQLLKNRVGNVSEVAYAVGFKKPRYFTTLFRKAFGINPSEYAADEGPSKEASG